MLLTESTVVGEPPRKNTMTDRGAAQMNVSVATSTGVAVRIAASLASVYIARNTALARAVTMPIGFNSPNPLTTSCVTKRMPAVASPSDTVTLNLGGCFVRRRVHRTTRTGAE